VVVRALLARGLARVLLALLLRLLEETLFLRQSSALLAILDLVLPHQCLRGLTEDRLVLAKLADPYLAIVVVVVVVVVIIIIVVGEHFLAATTLRLLEEIAAGGLGRLLLRGGGRGGAV